MSQIGSSEVLLILLVVLVLFGAKRLPELSRSIGRSARILKSETRGLREDSTSEPIVEQVPHAPAPHTSVPHTSVPHTAPVRSVDADARPVRDVA